MNVVDENECLTFFNQLSVDQPFCHVRFFLLNSCFKQNISNFYYPQHDQQDDHPQAVKGLGLEVLLGQQRWGDGELEREKSDPKKLTAKERLKKNR